MPAIKVVVHGALGKMGQEVLKTVCAQPDMEPVGAVDGLADRDSLTLPQGSGSILLSKSLADLTVEADVVVDFTNADGAEQVIRTAPPRRVNVVIGSTGIPDSTLREADRLAQQHQVGIIIAPNFALGAVLMIYLARAAARFFDYADVTELHHEAKIDAPSGTAVAIARATVEGKGGPFTAPKAAKEIIPGTRGGDHQGVSIHSARMPGLVAHHQLIFGTLGQTLTIRHDSINRESFMPGVTMAIREAVQSPGLIVGLDKIMGL